MAGALRAKTALRAFRPAMTACLMAACLMTAAYASPEVSNMAASSASRAGLPAQTTNWKAGK